MQELKAKTLIIYDTMAHRQLLSVGVTKKIAELNVQSKLVKYIYLTRLRVF